MLYFQWRNEERDLIRGCETFQQMYLRNEWTIQKNKKFFNTASDIIDMVENDLQEENLILDSVAPEVQHNEEIDILQASNISTLYGCFDPSQTGNTYDLALDLGITRKQLSTNDLVINDMSYASYIDLLRTLNTKQSAFFYHVLHWFKTEDTPIYCFLTGGAGVGKSIVTTVLYQAITRFFMKKLAECSDNIRAVLCAPTGKAAYNIGGNTIHSLFCIPANQGFSYKPLDAQQLDFMRVKFKNLKVVFIDEISMVGNRMFNFINFRLQEIFASDVPFAGVSVIAIGDLYQFKASSRWMDFFKCK